MKKKRQITAYSRSEIRENRMKWINFLMTKGRKKAQGTLDIGKGQRCCLGHGCYILGLKHAWVTGDEHDDDCIAYDGESKNAPESFQDMVGLWDHSGAPAFGELIIRNHEFDSLADANDELHAPKANSNSDSMDKINVTPRQIGKYLLSVIEGGTHTPFRLLTDYPE